MRERDRPRYFATLFAPAALRPDLFALYAFAAEADRIPDLVSEPAAGEIRLQWWRDSLDALEQDGATAGSPVLRALSAARGRHRLPLAPLQALVDARRSDLYADPPARLAALEGLLGETESALFQLAAIVCGSGGTETAYAAGHAGIAYGLTRRLAGFARDRARGRSILPLDLLAMEGLEAADIFAHPADPRLAKAAAALVALARHHLRDAIASVDELPKPLRRVILPLPAVKPQLRLIEQLGPDLARQPATLSDFQLLARFGWARLGGRFSGGA